MRVIYIPTRVRSFRHQSRCPVFTTRFSSMRRSTRRIGPGRRRRRDSTHSGDHDHRPPAKLRHSVGLREHLRHPRRTGLPQRRVASQGHGQHQRGEGERRTHPPPPPAPGDELAIANHKYTIQYQLSTGTASKTCSTKKRTYSVNPSWRRRVWRNPNAARSDQEESTKTNWPCPP